MTKAGKFFRKVGNWFSNVFNKASGQHLTGAEQEANAFSAQQAQLARDYETQMSNSSYQRGVVDMQKAGVNPALMYGQGAAGASTPSSPSPSSVSPEDSDPFGMLSMIMQLRTMGMDIKAKKLQNEKTEAEIENEKADTQIKLHTLPKIDAEVEQIFQNIANFKETLVGIKADNKLKEVAVKWADKEHEAALAFQNMSTEEKEQSIKESKARIDNLSKQNKKILAEVAETYENIKLIRSQKALNEKDLERLDSLIKNLDAQTDNLKKTGQLTQKDIDYYQWNHGKMQTFGGLSVHGQEYITPKDKHKDK